MWVCPERLGCAANLRRLLVPGPGSPCKGHQAIPEFWPTAPDRDASGSGTGPAGAALLSTQRVTGPGKYERPWSW